MCLCLCVCECITGNIKVAHIFIPAGRDRAIVSFAAGNSHERLQKRKGGREEGRKEGRIPIRKSVRIIVVAA